MSDLFKNGIDWHSDCDIFLLIEADLKYLQSKLPKYLIAEEVRPGVGLFAIGAQRFTSGNLNGKLPAFQEITFQIVVQPDLSLDVPIPKFALFVLNISSDSKEFLSYSYRTDKMPVYYAQNPTIQVSSESMCVKASDQQGDILHMTTAPEKIEYISSKIHVQVFTMQNNKIYFIPFCWEGTYFEHQQKNASTFKIYQHPFFCDIDINKLNNNCYLSMMSPGDITLSFYESIEYRNL